MKNNFLLRPASHLGGICIEMNHDTNDWEKTKHMCESVSVSVSEEKLGNNREALTCHNCRQTSHHPIRHEARESSPLNVEELLAPIIDSFRAWKSLILMP